jgi:hypothetical protein
MATVPGAAFALGQVPTLSGFDAVLNTMNTSPYVIGSMMLMMNLGARFLSLEVTKGQEAFLSHPWIRRFLIFVVFFIGTRNVWVAFWMALVVILLIGYLFNENSSLCLFRGGLPGSACKAGPKEKASLHEGFHAEDGDTTHMAAEGGDHGSKPLTAPAPTAGLTPEEQDILQKLLAKQQKYQQSITSASAAPEAPPKLYDIYKSNLEKVKNLF